MQKVIDSHVEPLEWGKNGRGMSAREPLPTEQQEYAKQAWNVARARALDVAEAMLEAGVHKQVANRILEPFLPMTMVVSGTNEAFVNFFNQRCHPDAQPEMQALAYTMRQRYNDSVPQPVAAGGWHLPYYGEELAKETVYNCVKACVARCARVSYLNHSGQRLLESDLQLYDKLASANPPHYSPMEHVAIVSPNFSGSFGNFSNPWVQLRKQLEYGENI